MKLSVILPVYNEKNTIDIILEKVRAVPIEKEIIIVDGNSTDGTKELLKKHEAIPGTTVIYQSARQGRGHALKEGIKIAKGDIIIFQDADLELDPSDYPELIKPIEEKRANVVFGSRFLKEKPKMTFFQYYGNKIINISVNLLFGSRLTDVETCYQVFTRQSVENISVKDNHFAFTVEMTVKLIKAGNNILEIPIKYNPRGRAEGKKVYWADGFVSLYRLIQLKFFEK